MSLDAIGAVGGVILLGDCRQISVVSTWKGAFSVSAIVEDLAAKFKWLVISVYDPNDNSSRRDFWRELDDTRCIVGIWSDSRVRGQRVGGCPQR